MIIVVVVCRNGWLYLMHLLMDPLCIVLVTLMHLDILFVFLGVICAWIVRNLWKVRNTKENTAPLSPKPVDSSLWLVRLPKYKSVKS